MRCSIETGIVRLIAADAIGRSTLPHFIF